jgi:hypothetical protein
MKVYMVISSVVLPYENLEQYVLGIYTTQKLAKAAATREAKKCRVKIHTYAEDPSYDEEDRKLVNSLVCFHRRETCEWYIWEVMVRRC